jgi:hypothetical protein
MECASCSSFRLYARRLDDRPPLFDFGFLQTAKRLGVLLLTRENLLAQFRKSRMSTNSPADHAPITIA